MEILSGRIIELIAKHFAGISDAEEAVALEQWLAENREHQQLVDRLKKSGDWRAGLETYERAVARTSETEEVVIAKVRESVSAHRARVRLIWGWRVAAACLVVALVGGGVWLYNRKPGNAIAPVAAARPALAPGGNRATLILANQKEIVLDDARMGSLAQQGNTNVTKADSTLLEYTDQSINHKPVAGSAVLAYNTVITPRAGQYKLRLSDGTTVYLNAQSSLRFPVAFNGKERRVELQGEGYFEVAKDQERPFRVDLGNGKEVTVLGTRFDVRDYVDDPGAAATLLDGSVRVTNGGRSAVLAVDERATLDPGGALSVARDEEPEASIAWTKGLFRFSNTDLREVMRQLSRWYDVDVVFEGTVPAVPITASINRNTSAWEVLDALKEIAGLKYRVEGKRIFVMH